MKKRIKNTWNNKDKVMKNTWKYENRETPKNIELSPWKTPLNYKDTVESVNKQLPKESSIEKWE